MPPDTDTVTAVASARGWPASAAVTVTVRASAAAPSATRSGDSARVTLVGGGGSSVIVTNVSSNGNGAATACTRTVSSGSSVSSSTAWRSNTAVPDVRPASMVRVKAGTAAKSSPSVAVWADTCMLYTVSPSRAVPFSVAVTVTRVVRPSAANAGDAERMARVDGDSSSVIVSVTSAGAVTARSFVATPETVTVLVAVCSSRLSTARTSTVPVLPVVPAGIVRAVPDWLKSAAWVSGPGAVEIVIVVGELDARSSTAVTRLTPAFSPTSSGVRTRVACGVFSLSSIVISSPAAGSTDKPNARPVSRTVSSGSSTRSSTGVSVKVSSPLVTFAGIVNVKTLTASKSAPRAAVTPDSDRLTSVSSTRAPASSAAVTVTTWAAASASSAKVSGDAVNVTSVEVASLSVMVTSVCRTSRSATVPPTITISPSPSSVMSSTGESWNVPSALVPLAGIVMVKSATSWKSVPSSAVPLPTWTVTSVSVGRGGTSSIAATVTVCAPPPSATSRMSTSSRTPSNSTPSSRTSTMTVPPVTST